MDLEAGDQRRTVPFLTLDEPASVARRRSLGGGRTWGVRSGRVGGIDPVGVNKEIKFYL
jgi:hypothetical protein